MKTIPCTSCHKVPEDGTLLHIGEDGKAEISDSGGLCTGCASLVLALPRCSQCGGGVGEILKAPFEGAEERICRSCRRIWWQAIVSGFSPEDCQEINRRALKCLRENPDLLLRAAIELLAGREIEGRDLLD